MKRILSALSTIVVSGAIALAASLPNVPSSPTFSGASQIVGTLNALIAQLNGGTGYAGASQNISLGSFCQNAAAGGTPQVCNGQRGQVAYTGITPTTTGSVQTLVITNSSVLANSQCTGAFITAFTAGSAMAPATFVATAGSLSVVVGNFGSTSNAVTTGTLAFNCI